MVQIAATSAPASQPPHSNPRGQHLLNAETKPTRSKSDAVRVRLNHVEKTAFERVAEAIGKKPSQVFRRLIREAITGGPEYFDDGLDELRAAHRELGAIGRNLNQLVKLANRGEQLFGHEVREELAAVVAQVDTVEKLYRDSVERIRSRSVTPAKQGRTA